jgi:hypothetical protein
MAKAYYSTVFEQPAAEVWKIVRDFNNYPVWVGGAGTSEIEDGKSGDTIGAVRSVLYQGRHIRPRLLAQSDIERSQSYEFCDVLRCRSPVSRRPCASPRSWMTTGPSSNGGRPSIARRPAAMN